jgi:hypothetical protein
MGLATVRPAAEFVDGRPTGNYPETSFWEVISRVAEVCRDNPGTGDWFKWA